MSKTIDKILDILDQPMQRSTEPAYPTERTDEGCWRCGVRLSEPTTVENDLGACARGASLIYGAKFRRGASAPLTN